MIWFRLLVLAGAALCALAFGLYALLTVNSGLDDLPVGGTLLLVAVGLTVLSALLLLTVAVVETVLAGSTAGERRLRWRTRVCWGTGVLGAAVLALTVAVAATDWFAVRSLDPGGALPGLLAAGLLIVVGAATAVLPQRPVPIAGAVAVPLVFALAVGTAAAVGNPWTAQAGVADTRLLERSTPGESVPSGSADLTLRYWQVGAMTEVTPFLDGLAFHDDAGLAVFAFDGSGRWHLDLSGFPGDEAVTVTGTGREGDWPTDLLVSRGHLYATYDGRSGRLGVTGYREKTAPVLSDAEPESEPRRAVTVGDRRFRIVGADVTVTDADGAGVIIAPVTLAAPCPGPNGRPMGLDDAGNSVAIISCVGQPGTLVTVAIS